MRVLLNAVAGSIGGAVRHLNGLVPALDAYGGAHEWIVATNLPLDARLPPTGDRVRVRRVATTGGAWGRARWESAGVLRMLREERADVLVSLLNFGPLRAPVAHVVFERNALYFARGDVGLSARDRAQARARRALAGAVMARAAAVVVPSEAMRADVQAAFPRLPSDRVTVVPHGFDADGFAKAASATLPPRVAEAMRPAGDTLRLLYVSHPAPHKGFEVLFAGLRRALDAGVRARLFLTIERADWPGVRAYERTVRELALSDAVVLLGRVPQDAVAAVYAEADAFVFPSRCESFGFPLVEAMATRLPVVAAGTPIARELCVDAALYYAPTDADELAARLAQLAADPAARRGLAARGGERAQRFSWKKNVESTIALLEGL